jgi:hypothetical protein
MKLSDKILLGFLGFIFLYLTAAFAELRLTGIPNIINDKNSIAETVDLPGVAYVVLNDIDLHINVNGSDRPRLEVRSIAGGLLKNLTYTIAGDTLTLSGFQSKETQTIRISVFVPKTSLKGIAVNASTASVRGLQQELLHISQNSGQIWMSDSDVAKIDMDVSNRSQLDISNTTLDTLSVKIEGSRVFISSPAGFVQGSMTNKSFLRLGNIREIQLKKDESSAVNLYH